MATYTIDVPNDLDAKLKAFAQGLNKTVQEVLINLARQAIQHPAPRRGYGPKVVGS